MDEIDKLIDWSAVVKLLDRIYGSDEGRPSYPLLTYVKLLLLQQWYGLSDPGLEEAVDDRLSFRRFAGLPLDEGVPDHSTIWRFRQELAAHGLAEALFEEINRQLDARGLIVRQGTLIDATLLQAAVDGGRLPLLRLVEIVEPGIAVRLQQAAEACEVRLRMLALAVRAVAVDGRRAGRPTAGRFWSGRDRGRAPGQGYRGMQFPARSQHLSQSRRSAALSATPCRPSSASVADQGSTPSPSVTLAQYNGR